MKYIKALILTLLVSHFSSAQIVNPTHWSWKAEKVKDKEYKLIFTAQIDAPWHTYGMYIGDGGPVKTSFAFTKNPDVELVGKMTETGTKVHEGMDEVFQMNVKSFEGSATFTQLVRVKKTTTIKGSLEFMVCNDKSCLAPDTKEWSIDINPDAAGTGQSETPLPATRDVEDNTAVATAGTSSPASVSDSTHPAGIDAAPIANHSALSPYYQNFFNKNKYGAAINPCNREEPLTTWLAFILGFGGGLLALLTPCVFPMIPLTVSFFTKRSENKSRGKFESIFYGFCIMGIFFLLSMPFLFLNLSPNALNAISTNWTVNLFFFVVFIIFAFSFFGYYEIGLPSSWANKVDNASNAGGLIGIFFMALTLVIISFSCTGPILGTLLGSMATSPNGKLNLVLGMTSFGLAMGLPFTLFALFPNLLKALPKSGSWMDTVKIVFGFLELIFALKFLSNVDLVLHLGLLKKEIFLGLWAILGAALTLYLAGILKIKYSGPVNRLAPVRLALIVASFLFTAYSAMGTIGIEVPLFSGFAPPNYYSIFPKKTECPNQLSCFHDYDEALAYARKQGKPLFIDFTGYNCANCRKMEESIWSDPLVYSRMSEKYVIVSLYVDDYERKLPDSAVYVNPSTGSKRTSYGHKWSDFQTECFQTNTQPEYVLVSTDERLLNDPWKGYDANPKKFQGFLDCGLDAFKTVASVK